MSIDSRCSNPMALQSFAATVANSRIDTSTGNEGAGIQRREIAARGNGGICSASTLAEQRMSVTLMALRWSGADTAAHAHAAAAEVSHAQRAQGVTTARGGSAHESGSVHRSIVRWKARPRKRSSR